MQGKRVKTATLETLEMDSACLDRWISEGEPVVLTRGGEKVGTFVPADSLLPDDEKAVDTLVLTANESFWMEYSRTHNLKKRYERIRHIVEDARGYPSPDLAGEELTPK